MSWHALNEALAVRLKLRPTTKTRTVLKEHLKLKHEIQNFFCLPTVQANGINNCGQIQPREEKAEDNVKKSH